VTEDDGDESDGNGAKSRDGDVMRTRGHAMQGNHRNVIS
jgi:hypothetical protein